MIAAFCLLIPPLIMVLIRNKLFPKQTKFYHKIIQYLGCVIAINGLILLLLLAFFTNGGHLIYNLNHQTIFAVKYIALALTFAIAEPFIEKKLKVKHISSIIKVATFLLLLVVGFRIVNFIVQPIWESYDYNPTHSIYNEPENSIETLFLGTSHIRNGILPMELYENYGICAYDMSTSGQPVPASYYWVEEIYRLNSETLDTVVFDVNHLNKSSSTSNYHKAFDPMQFSTVKLRAVKTYSGNFTDFLTNLIPIFSYHERWEELSNTDFLKYDQSPLVFLRGYAFTYSQWIKEISDYSEAKIPLLIADETTEATTLNEEALEYFDKMVSFCKERDIRLVLIKTPVVWSSGDHNAIQELADKYELDFIDFNIEPYYSEIEYNLAANSITPSDTNNLHANYFGALKITNYLGEYLIEECDNKDVRGDVNYAFMDAELEDYNRYIIKTKLGEIEDPAQYLSYLLNQDDYEIFISVKEDGAQSLTDEQREVFASVGLEELSSIEFRDSYLAVIDDGVVLTEDLKRYDQDIDANGEKEKITETMSVSLEGILGNGSSYSLTSCGGKTVAKSSCILDNTEYSQNSRGINFVVYDKRLQRVADNVTFDTFASSTRKPVNIELALEEDLNEGLSYVELSNNEQELYLYDMQCNASLAEKTSYSDGLFDYMSYFWDDEDYTIFISSKGDASEALSDETRSFLLDIGLTQLSKLQFEDSYVAIISDGCVIEEMHNHEEDPIEVTGSGYSLVSGCYDSNNVSSIIVNGTEYSLNTQGLNIVVMNNWDSSVLSAKTFNTSEITPTIPEDWLS